MKIFKRLKNFRYTKTFAILLGLSATIWFLIRVIPKPSRAHYPCMKVAAPLMSSFVIYLLGIGASVFSFKKIKSSIRSSKFLVAGLFAVLFVVSLSVFLLNDPTTSFASSLKAVDETFPITSNTPIGEAQGLFPGRVVWAHNPGATNENYNPEDPADEWWYGNSNANEAIIKGMLASALTTYAEEDSQDAAWNAIFTSFNEKHGKGAVGYVAGEKIAIKVNLTNSCCALSPEQMDISPQVMNALLHELTVNAGVAQSDITIGDPYRDFRSEYQELVTTKYPEVNYVDGNGGSGGIIKTVPSTEEVLVFSKNKEKSTLPKYYIDAEYFINMPCLKTHDEGGITLIAKNHQGSFLPIDDDPADQSAYSMHYSLPKNSTGQGNYRHTVDYMGHEETGGKALIYIVDGIWGGESWQGYIKKFKSAPFNNDYPNSLFIGQDPVAIESVGFDILFEEYLQDDSKENHPIVLKNEIADYLMQCASSDYWPDGITYDPEGDGSPIGSLGVFEHWNNPTDRQYSGNLESGNGIELLYTTDLVSTELYRPEMIIDAYPNPFSTTTVFSKTDDFSSKAELSIYAMNGKLVQRYDFSNVKEIRWNGNDMSGNSLSNGTYIYTVTDLQSDLHYSGKVLLSR